MYTVKYHRILISLLPIIHNISPKFNVFYPILITPLNPISAAHMCVAMVQPLGTGSLPGGIPQKRMNPHLQQPLTVNSSMDKGGARERP